LAPTRPRIFLSFDPLPNHYRRELNEANELISNNNKKIKEPSIPFIDIFVVVVRFEVQRLNYETLNYVI